jgi:hypothetical protein
MHTSLSKEIKYSPKADYILKHIDRKRNLSSGHTRIFLNHLEKFYLFYIPRVVLEFFCFSKER